MTTETEIAERLARATKGPWHMHDVRGIAAITGPQGVRIASDMLTKNADFIAHAPEDIAALLARVATLSGLLREARGAIAAYANLPFVGWSGDAYSLTARIDAALGETQG